MGLEIVRAESVRDAAAILASDSGAHFIGGGTLAVRDVNYGNGSISKLVHTGSRPMQTVRGLFAGGAGEGTARPARFPHHTKGQ